MKKTLIMALALAAPVFAGDGKGVTIPVVKADSIPTTEAIVAPVAAPAAFSLEIGPSYFEWENDMNVKTDWEAIDLTAIYHITPNWSANLRFACGVTSNSYVVDEYVDENHNADHYDEDSTDWFIAPGIRYSVGLTDSITWYIGANIGYGKSKVEETWQEYHMGAPIPGETEKYEESTKAWFYSAETGVQWHCTESLYIYGAVQYSIFKPSSSDWCEQKGTGVRIGLGIDF